MVSDKDFPVYLEMCGYLKRITELYITDNPAFLLEAEGLVLQTVSKLLVNFAKVPAPLPGSNDQLVIKRIRSITSYVEEHFREPVTLEEAASLLGIGKEYFCRFFKKEYGDFILTVPERSTCGTYLPGLNPYR